MHAGEKNGQARLRKIEGRAEGFCMEMVRPYIYSIKNHQNTEVHVARWAKIMGAIK